MVTSLGRYEFRYLDLNKISGNIMSSRLHIPLHTDGLRFGANGFCDIEVCFEEEGKVKDRGLIGGHYCLRRFRNCHFVPSLEVVRQRPDDTSLNIIFQREG